MASKQPLGTWLAEMFFEDNEQFQRRTPRALGLLRKAAGTVPHAVALFFCNFAAAYPRSKNEPQPRAEAASGNLKLELASWPRHPDTGAERGLPLSDSVAATISFDESLASVGDLIFAMREIHRVCANNASVRMKLVETAALAADPTLLRPITTATLEFFTPRSAKRAKAEAAGAAGLFEIATVSDGYAELRVIKATTPVQPAKIDIGCGTSPRAGYAGVDFLALPGVEIIRDVDKHGLPFSDSTITHVYTAHFLEHVRSLVFVMNEIHRVSCHDAIVEISVPTLLGPYAAADPTHVHLFNARTFSYFEAGSEPYAGIVKGFEILEQSVGFSLNVKLRVVKR